MSKIIVRKSDNKIIEYSLGDKTNFDRFNNDSYEIISVGKPLEYDSIELLKWDNGRIIEDKNLKKEDTDHLMQNILKRIENIEKKLNR